MFAYIKGEEVKLDKNRNSPVNPDTITNLINLIKKVGQPLSAAPLTNALSFHHLGGFLWEPREPYHRIARPDYSLQRAT